MQDGKIKILVIPDDYTGIAKFRSIGPHKYIQEHYGDEFIIDIVYMKDVPKDDRADYFSQYDIIQYHKKFANSLSDLELIKFLGIPTVIDVDDSYDLGPDHPLYLTAKKEHWKDIITKHISMSDYVTTTTPLFANDLKKFNKNVYVFPNAIDPEEPQFVQKKTASDKIRFGIVCGYGHLADIRLMEGIAALPKEIRDKMQIVLCGFDTRGVMRTYKKNGEVEVNDLPPEKNTWTKYEEFLTNNYALVSPEHKAFLRKFMQVDDIFNNEFYVRKWTRDIQKYAKHYEGIDVLLAPLKENFFNYVKSELKEIECGFTNTALIAQDYGPYKINLIPYIEKGGNINPEGNALLVDPAKNHKQWAKYMKYVVEHPECIQIMSNNLAKLVKENYTLEKVCAERVELYRKIIQEKCHQKA